MSRGTPRGPRQLPALVPVDGGEYDNLFSSRSDGRSSRLDVLEDRLHQQERTSQQLLDRAYRIKEDIVSSLNFTHGTWQEEKQARSLLQDHIRTITDVVKKLNRDITVIEQQIQVRQGSSDSTVNAVKTLEIQQVSSITDLRGRVARCDGAISKLAMEVKVATDQTKSIGQGQQDLQSKLLDRISGIDSKISDLYVKVERTYSDQQLRIRSVEGDSSTQLTALDSKTKSLIDEVRNAMLTQRRIEETEREKLEMRITGHIEKASLNRETRMEKMEKRVEETLARLTKQVQRQENDLQKEREDIDKRMVTLENKLVNLADDHGRRQNEEIQRLKKECRHGFSTVHETITNMNQVMEGKRKLLEEQLRKEVAQIRKTLVLI